MKSRIIGWIVIILFTTTLIGGFFLLKNYSSGAPDNFGFATTTLPLDAATSTSEVPQVQLPPVPDGFKQYKSDQYGFALDYPQELPANESHDEGYAMTVAFQEKSGEAGFQIYVAPINGTQITPDRFHMDEPSGVRRDPKDRTVDGVQAVSFHGFDAAMGETYEIWFIRGGFLYEISTYKELGSWLDDIMKTWRFTPIVPAV